MSIADEIAKIAGGGNANSTHQATVLRTDNDGTTWVSIPGGADETPLRGVLAECRPGDSVEVAISGGKAVATANATSPAATVRSVRAVDGRVDAVSGQVDVMRLDVDLASQAATEAKAVAEATGQHFWEDDNGAHVTEITKDEWKAEEAKETPFADVSDAKPYHNLLMNSLGILLRTALKNLVSITRSAIAFFDGQGNDAANVVASFGKDGAQIGKAGGVYVALRNNKFELNNADAFKPTQFGLLNDADTGLATLEESNSATYLYNGGTLLGCGITVSSNIQSLVSVTLNGSEAQAEVVPGKMVVVDGAAYGDEVTAVYTTKATVSFAQFGRGSTARGVNSFASGTSASANGQSAFAEGDMSQANGFASHAEGSSSNATGYASHAEGQSDATGNYAHSEGYNSISNGSYSHAQNNQTIAASASQTALGKYNVEDANGQHAVIIGNGTSDSARSNALTVGWDGSVDAAGGAMLGGTLDVGFGTTLRGNLNMELHEGNATHLLLHDARMDRSYGGVPTTGAQVERCIGIQDKDDNWVGRLTFRQEASGMKRTILEAVGADSSGTLVWNSISAAVDKNGTRSYSVSYPAAFCEALHVGDYVTDSASNVSTATSAYKDLFDFTLAAGTWLVFANLEFAANATGRRVAALNTTAGGSGISLQWRATEIAVSGAAIRVRVTGVLRPSASTKYYLTAWQNSGGNLNVTGVVQAVRIK